MERNQVNVLASIDDDGRIVILRFHKGETIVEADHMNIICGTCGERVFIREKNVTNTDNRQ